MRGIGLAIALAATAATGAAAQPAPKPEWLTRPSGRDIALVYPQLAMVLGLEGRARVTCRSNDEGALVDCRVLAESPAGLGFGWAALSLTSKFRMKPGPAGEDVELPIRFVLPAAQPLGALPPPPEDPKRIQLARRMAAAQWASGHPQARMAERHAQLRAGSKAGSDPAVVDAGIAALREASVELKAEKLEGVALVYALALTAAELEVHAAYEESETARALAVQRRETERLRERLARSFSGQIRDRARASFCTSHDCRVEADFASGRAPSGGPNLIYAPTWAARPDARLIWESYPVIPMGLGLDGWAGLVCRADSDGMLKDCRTEAESPAGLGFGAAGRVLADHYRLSPAASRGADREVWLAIQFRSPWAPTPEATYPALDGARLALAREAVSQENGGFPAVEADADWARIRGQAESQGVPASTIDAARAARIAAAAEVGELRKEATAGLLGQHLDDAQLAALIAYRRTEAYRQQPRELLEHKDVMALADAVADRQLATRAREIFCAAHACQSVPAAVAGR